LPCPIVLPFKGELPTGINAAYLAFMTMQKVSFAPGMIMRLGHVSDLYFKTGLYAGTQPVNDLLIARLKSEWGATAVVNVSVVPRPRRKVELLIQWEDGSVPRQSELRASADHPETWPGKVALKIHDFLGTELSPVERLEMAQPVYKDEKNMAMASQGELLYRGNFAWAWQWEVLKDAEPDNEMVANRAARVSNELLFEGPELKNWGQNHPGHDYMSIQDAMTDESEAQPQKALALLLPLLAKDSRNPWVMNCVLTALEQLDSWSQADWLVHKLRGSDVLTGRFAGECAKFYIDYAWHARGDGPGNQVGDWNGRLFKLRLQEAENLVSGVRTEANPHPLEWTELLVAQRGLNAPAKDLDGTFAASEAVSPFDDDPCLMRMEDLKAEWDGSDALMFAFAKKNAQRHPSAVLGAYDSIRLRILDENGGKNTGKDSPELAALRQMNAWPDLSAAHHRMLERNPLDVGLWTDYLMQANWFGKTDEAIAYLKASEMKYDELKYFAPHLVALAVWMLGDIEPNFDTRWHLMRSGKWWDMTQDAINKGLILQPQDRFFQSYFLKQAVWWERWSLARRLFNVIGDQRVPLVYNEAEFIEDKKKAFGPEGQIEP
jgi:hypothetical protein